MATCELPSKSKLIIVPEDDGYYGRDPSGRLNIDLKSFKLGKDITLRAITMLSGESQSFTGIREGIIIVARGIISVDSICTPKQDWDACLDRASAGEVIKYQAPSTIPFTATTVSAVENSAIILVTFPNASTVGSLIAGSKFEKTKIGTAMFVYNKCHRSEPIVEKDMATFFPSPASFEHVDVRINLVDTPPFSFFEGGITYPGAKSGTIEIKKNDAALVWQPYDKLQPGTLQLVIPLPPAAKVSPPEVKNFLEMLVKSPMKLHTPFYKSKGAEITLNNLDAGASIAWEIHDEDQIVMVLSGKLKVSLEGPVRKWMGIILGSGDSIEIPLGWKHLLETEGAEPARFISIYADVGAKK
jgi:quercetin dioxygenase-like cupin family protein